MQIKAWRSVVSALPASSDWLVKEVTDEINDPDYIHLRHGARHTRNKGCQGPLCKKALRDQQLAQRRRAAQRVGLEPRQYTRSTQFVVIDPMLIALKRAHDSEFDARTKRPQSTLQTAGAA